MCLSVNYGDIGRQAANSAANSWTANCRSHETWHPERIETSLNQDGQIPRHRDPRELEQRPTSCIDERTVCEHAYLAPITPFSRAGQDGGSASGTKFVVFFGLILVLIAPGMSWYFIHSKRLAMTEQVRNLGVILVKIRPQRPLRHHHRGTSDA